MVLHTVRDQNIDIPSDAVRLSRRNALAFQLSFISKWEPKSDVFFLSNGPFILGLATSVNGILINNFFRQRMRLLNFGRIGSYLPVVVLPSLLNVIGQVFEIRNSVLLNEACPVCLEIRSSLIQLSSSVLMPLCLSGISSLILANMYNTYPLPLLNKEPKAVFKVWFKLVRSQRYSILMLCAFNILLASFVTYKEGQETIEISEMVKKSALEKIEKNS